ncbi:MAG: hypothetical protein IKQ82_07220 [Lentisphaeria bacterium]|nr:hypothetical protein [Lentisphaeria bacterium]
MLSILSSLLRLISSGITIGSKKETKIDVSKKHTTLGSNNSFSETTIGTLNNTIVALPDSEIKASLLLETNPPVKELLDQANSIMRQIVENNEERLLVIRRYGRIETILFLKSKKQFPITDKVAIPDALKYLNEQNYLDYSWHNDRNTQFVYNLTLKGREYGKRLLASENKGNTPI